MSVAAAVPISAVVVTWNGKEMARACLASLEAHTPGIDLQVIVVDNASTDGVADAIAAEFPNVTLVRNTTNAGFARANNQGMELATGKYVCLINSDVEVPPDCLEKMALYMEQNPSIGVLGPKMLSTDGKVGDSAMRWPSVWNSFCRALGLDTRTRLSKKLGGALMRDFAYDRIADVQVLTGWFWMVRREALAQVGGLDEQFFMYGEDIDWCRRYWQAGWRVVFYPNAEALHYGGGSSAKAPIRFAIEMLRARLQYIRKHHSIFARIAFRVTLWLHHLLRIAGYGVLLLLSKSHRAEAAFKVRQSCACLLWLARTRSHSLAEN